MSIPARKWIVSRDRVFTKFPHKKIPENNALIFRDSYIELHNPTFLNPKPPQVRRLYM